MTDSTIADELREAAEALALAHGNSAAAIQMLKVAHRAATALSGQVDEEYTRLSEKMTRMADFIARTQGEDEVKDYRRIAALLAAGVRAVPVANGFKLRQVVRDELTKYKYDDAGLTECADTILQAVHMLAAAPER